MQNIHNNNCDGGHCKSQAGQVRLLPLGADGNLILCHSCYEHEIQHRRERNKTLEKFAQFKLPTWTDLEIYRE